MAVGTCATYGWIHAMAGNTADVGIVTKLDLATAVEFDWPAAQRSLDAVRPRMRILKLSAKTGEGMDEWWQLLESLKAAVSSSAPVSISDVASLGAQRRRGRMAAMTPRPARAAVARAAADVRGCAVPHLP
jgi:putative protein kinase ArgK-like GTPase of G3E family